MLDNAPDARNPKVYIFYIKGTAEKKCMSKFASSKRLKTNSIGVVRHDVKVTVRTLVGWVTRGWLG